MTVPALRADVVVPQPIPQSVPFADFAGVPMDILTAMGARPGSNLVPAGGDFHLHLHLHQAPAVPTITPVEPDPVPSYAYSADYAAMARRNRRDHRRELTSACMAPFVVGAVMWSVWTFSASLTAAVTAAASTAGLVLVVIAVLSLLGRRSGCPGVLVHCPGH